MVLRGLLSFLTLVFMVPCAMPQNAAYSEAVFDKRYLDTMDLIEQDIRVQLPEFRLIKSDEQFTKRRNAMSPIKTKFYERDVQVTLHDMATGEPLETCLSPCELLRQAGFEYWAVGYKYGHFPYVFPVFPEDEFIVFQTDIGMTEILDLVIACRRTFEGLKRKIDGNAAPCVRQPPRIPMEAERSGHCYVNFDVDEQGYTENIRVDTCSEEMFRLYTEDAVSWWYYKPKVLAGTAVKQLGERSKVIFVLSDENGEVIPE